MKNLDKQKIEKFVKDHFAGRRVIVCVAEVTAEGKLDYFRHTQDFPIADLPKFVEQVQSDCDLICKETDSK